MSRGIEEAGRGEAEKGIEHVILSIEAPQLQIALALSAYRRAHKEDKDLPPIDPTHWEHNDPAIQSAAMSEWIRNPDDPNSLAALYGSYRKEHPQEQVDITDEVALTTLLETLANKQNSSIH